MHKSSEASLVPIFYTAAAALINLLYSAVWAIVQCSIIPFILLRTSV